MLVENYGRLSRRVLISYTGDKLVERFSKRFSISAPISIVNQEGKISAFYYFPGDFAKDREKEIFLKQFNARMNEGLWTTYTNSDAEPELLYFKELMNIPSLVLEDSQLINGMHYFSAKFDENYSPMVSRFLLDLIDRDSNFQIEEIGPNSGIADLKKFIHSERKLRFVRLIMNKNQEAGQESFVPPPESVLEVKFLSRRSNSSGIYYLSAEPENMKSRDFARILEGVYEGPIYDPVVQSVLFYSGGIPLKTLSAFARFLGTTVIMEMVMDQWSSVVLLKGMKRITESQRHLEIYLDAVQEFNFKG